MKLLALDGNSIINRAFYGVKLLTTKEGEFTNAVYGFLNILGSLETAEQPDGIVVAFDLRAPTFRHKMYPEYKAGRRPMPPELASQFPILKEILDCMGITCLEKEGYEADDILGTLAAVTDETGDECVIATGDRDSLQLVSPTTRVLLAATRAGHPEITNCTVEWIAEKYGVSPAGLIEIKALQGDASDNIPGVAGVGEKTAATLIAQYGSIDKIYEDLEVLDVKDSLRDKLAAGRDSAYLSRELGTICRTVPISRDVESYRLKERNDAELGRIFRRLEFFSFIKKMGLSVLPGRETVAFSPSSFAAADEREVSAAAEKCGRCDILLSDDVYIAVSDGKISPLSDETLITLAANGGIKKRVSDSKALHKKAETRGRRAEGVVFDSALAGYLINPSSNSYDTERLAAEHSVVQPTVGGGEDIHRAAALHSAVCDALEKQLVSINGEKLLSDIELPLARVLAKMELAGFMIDSDGIAAYGEKLGERIEALTAAIYENVGYEFNINSPKQLGEALFEKLGLPCRKKTKSGYSTNAEVLESLATYHPVIEQILEYRRLSKLKSTYCDALVPAADGDMRIRSTLNQTETRTGRISSAEPNLQNIPVRREEGRELRRYFRAADGCLLCDADYSQIELRVLASIADDAAMIEAFKNGVDIHALTASQVFDMPLPMVTPLMRSRAKAVNFGIVYGIGAFSLAKDIGVTRAEADNYIKGYMATYPAVARYMETVVKRAKEDGFVTTLFGRRRLLPELSSSNGMLRAFGERVARNMPIQGTAADIIKIAMIRVCERLEKELPSARLIMQVHDELIIEAPEADAPAACEILKSEMEKAVELKVPLTVDVHSGRTWYDAKG